MAGRKLETYRRKRDFDVTSEPSPQAAPKRAAKDAPRFMVHKHDATRLHYDLRLEIDEALASWAIPRGPSLDPHDRRLAVETEDHPLAYGEFEGRIPEGEYGAGDSLIWDRGTYETVPPGQAAAMREKGHLHLELRGEKLRGRWHLVRTRTAGTKQQWLLFKARDEFAEPGRDLIAARPESVVSGRRITRGPIRKRVRVAKHPSPIELLMRVWPPMLATLAKPGSVRPSDVSEVKYDGFRALAALSGGELALQSRNGLDLSRRFPRIATALATLDLPEAVLDGEVVACDHQGVSRFELLQQGETKQRYVAFDLLWLDGEDLRDRPLEDRRELLESALANTQSPIELAERLPGTPNEALSVAKQRGLEGILVKRHGSRYVGGRSREWLKMKLILTQDVAIAGYLPISSGERLVGALLVAVRDGDTLRYAGKVGTGFTDRVRRELWRRLEQSRTHTPQVTGAPRMRAARWVVPELVAEVAFTEWTSDGKLRHPSFKGLRADKLPSETAPERS